MLRIVFLTLSVSAALVSARTPKIPGQSDCGLNEIFRECSSMCEEKCGEYVPTRPCPASCGPPKCQCDVGFYRNSTGACITRPECEEQNPPRSQSDCGPNSTFNNCSSLCQHKCGDYEEKPCLPSCGPPKCECNAGFYFNQVGDCVSRADCDAEGLITCANIDCVSGFICKMQNGRPACFAGKSVTCEGIECDVGHHCEILSNGVPTCIRTAKPPKLTCANVRCAGRCRDTPTGFVCSPRPQVLPISVGPSSEPQPKVLPISAYPTANATA